MDLTTIAAIVAAFGSILGPWVLYLTRQGSINDNIKREIRDDFNQLYQRLGQIDRDAKERSETEVRRLDDRLRAVEISSGKVDQQAATLERHLLTVDNRLRAVESSGGKP